MINDESYTKCANCSKNHTADQRTCEAKKYAFATWFEKKKTSDNPQDKTGEGNNNSSPITKTITNIQNTNQTAEKIDHQMATHTTHSHPEQNPQTHSSTLPTLVQQNKTNENTAIPTAKPTKQITKLPPKLPPSPQEKHIASLGTTPESTPISNLANTQSQEETPDNTQYHTHSISPTTDQTITYHNENSPPYESKSINTTTNKVISKNEDIKQIMKAIKMAMDLLGNALDRICLMLTQEMD